MRENVIHVKFEYVEAHTAKTMMLQAQMNSLRALQAMRNYKVIRTDELKLKTKLNQKLNALNDSIKKTQSFLPNSHLPSIINKKKSEIKKKVETSNSNDNSDIEIELQKIQEKLRDLQRS